MNKDKYICPHCGESEHIPNEETLEAMKDVVLGRNVEGFETKEELFNSWVD